MFSIILAMPRLSNYNISNMTIYYVPRIGQELSINVCSTHFLNTSGVLVIAVICV